jgi:hypothetical protein
MAPKTADLEAETTAERRAREEAEFDAAAPNAAVAGQEEAETPPSDEVEESEPPIEERPDGQLAIGGPGTEPRFSTDAGGPPPEEGEFVLKSYRCEWGYDMKRGDDLCLLVHARIGPVVIGAKKVFPADVLAFVEFETPMGAREALMAVHDLRSRAQYDRAVIDNAAAVAQELFDNTAFEGGIDLAAEMREALYKRYKIEDSAQEATYGVEFPTVITTPGVIDSFSLEAVSTEDEDEDGEIDAAPEAELLLAPTDAPDEAKLAARESSLETAINEAIAAGDAEREDALRDELAGLQTERLEADPDLTWKD